MEEAVCLWSNEPSGRSGGCGRQTGKIQYNGLGHRVGKQEGVLPKEKLEKLDPQRRVGMEIGNSRQITYTLDLTRQYYNLLERTEEKPKPEILLGWERGSV